MLCCRKRRSSIALDAVRIQNESSTQPRTFNEVTTDATQGCHKCGKAISRFCVSYSCDEHCVEQRCPLHLPIMLLQCTSAAQRSALQASFVNGVWECANVQLPLSSPSHLAAFTEAKTTLTASFGECPLCYEAMLSAPVCVLHDENGLRRCSHVFHTKCLGDVMAYSRKTTVSSCPLCYSSFYACKELPDIEVDYDGWWEYTAGHTRAHMELNEAIEFIGYIVNLPKETKHVALPGAAAAQAVHADHSHVAHRTLKPSHTMHIKPDNSFTQVKVQSPRKSTISHGLENANNPRSRVSEFLSKTIVDASPSSRWRPSFMSSSASSAKPEVLPCVDRDGFYQLYQWAKERASDRFVDGVDSKEKICWFELWDGDRNGYITQMELVRGCVKSYAKSDVRTIAAVEWAVNCIWVEVGDGRKQIPRQYFDVVCAPRISTYFFAAGAKRQSNFFTVKRSRRDWYERVLHSRWMGSERTRSCRRSTNGTGQQAKELRMAEIRESKSSTRECESKEREQEIDDLPVYTMEEIGLLHEENTPDDNRSPAHDVEGSSDTGDRNKAGIDYVSIPAPSTETVTTPAPSAETVSLPQESLPILEQVSASLEEVSLPTHSMEDIGPVASAADYVSVNACSVGNIDPPDSSDNASLPAFTMDDIGQVASAADYASVNACSIGDSYPLDAVDNVILPAYSMDDIGPVASAADYVSINACSVGDSCQPDAGDNESLPAYSMDDIGPVASAADYVSVTACSIGDSCQPDAGDNVSLPAFTMDDIGQVASAADYVSVTACSIGDSCQPEAGDNVSLPTYSMDDIGQVASAADYVSVNACSVGNIDPPDSSDNVSLPAFTMDDIGPVPSAADYVSINACSIGDSCQQDAGDNVSLPAYSMDDIGQPVPYTNDVSLPVYSMDDIGQPAPYTNDVSLPVYSMDDIGQPAPLTDDASLPAYSMDDIGPAVLTMDNLSLPGHTSIDGSSIPTQTMDDSNSRTYSNAQGNGQDMFEFSSEDAPPQQSADDSALEESVYDSSSCSTVGSSTTQSVDESNASKVSESDAQRSHSSWRSIDDCRDIRTDKSELEATSAQSLRKLPDAKATTREADPHALNDGCQSSSRDVESAQVSVASECLRLDAEAMRRVPLQVDDVSVHMEDVSLGQVSISIDSSEYTLSDEEVFLEVMDDAGDSPATYSEYRVSTSSLSIPVIFSRPSGWLFRVSGVSSLMSWMFRQAARPRI